MSKLFFRAKDFVGINQEPGDLPDHILDRTIREGEECTKICAVIAASHDLRSIDGGIPLDEFEKSIREVHIVCVLEALKRVGRIEVKGKLSFNPNEEFEIRKVAKSTK